MSEPHTDTAESPCEQAVDTSVQLKIYLWNIFLAYMSTQSTMKWQN